MEDASAEKVICLSSGQIEIDNMDVEQDPEVVISMSNMETLPSMLGSSCSQLNFFEVNLSSINGATISMPTFSVNSLIDTCPTSLIPQLFEDDIPSISMSICENEYFPMSSFITSLTFTSVSSPMDIAPLRIDIPINQMETDSLVTIQQEMNSSSEVRAYFGEDAVVSMGKYYWSKKDKAVVKRGSKKARHGLGKHVSTLGQVIWKADTSNLPQEAVDAATAMGVFTGANFSTISQLSLAFGEKEKELDKLKHDLAEVENRYQQEIGKLK